VVLLKSCIRRNGRAGIPSSVTTEAGHLHSEPIAAINRDPPPQPEQFNFLF